MAHLKQSKKRIRTNEKARVRNLRQRSAMKTAIKKVVTAETKDVAAAAFPTAMSRVDKAAKKNVIHRNAAARLKSRMAKRIAKMGK
ncbi:MAG: 30S ribosomal protein S20 [Planctomycetes bacterium]|nr:30S ribosomal protein S20 [Planctomycetota bacterium]